MQQNGLYIKIKGEFDTLLNSTKSAEFPDGNPNALTAANWHTSVAKAIKEFIESRVTCYCTYAGMTPSETPDPLTTDSWKPSLNGLTFTVPSDFQSWLLMISNAFRSVSLISGTGTNGVVLSSPIFILGSSNFTLSQDTLRSKGSLDEMWDWIGDELLDWYRSNVNSSGSTQGSHPAGSSTGPVTLTSNAS